MMKNDVINIIPTIAPHGEKGAVWMHGQKGTTRLDIYIFFYFSTLF